MEFLKFLRGKEETLTRICREDLRQRKLSEATKTAVQSLGFVELNIFRSILCEILHKTHFLHFWNADHPKIAFETTMEDLMAKAIKIILDLSIEDDEHLKRLGTSREDLEARGWAPRTWVEVVVLLVVEDEAMASERLKGALDFHRLLADKASSHLGLIAENLTRTHWQAAALLSKNAEKARASARTLVRHLARTSPANRTFFEQHLFEDPVKWSSLVAFSRANPPVRLWHGRGLFEDLFRWLATLFLVGPDHEVLDCERIHARWKWLCETKRALNLPALNAILKITHYLDRHEGQLPADGDLAEHLRAAYEQLKWNLEDLRADENIARGWRLQMLFRDRFNVGPEDFNLLMHIDSPVAALSETYKVLSGKKPSKRPKTNSQSHIGALKGPQG